MNTKKKLPGKNSIFLVRTAEIVNEFPREEEPYNVYEAIAEKDIYKNN